MANEAAKLTARTRVDNTGLTRGMQEADRIMRQSTQQIQRTATTGGGQIGSALGEALASKVTGVLSVAGLAVGAIKAARAVGEITKELYIAGAAAERLTTGFESLAGAGASDMLGGLREAARGTIDDMSLMTAANRAMMLGVTKDADTMARLLEVAVARGRNLGVGAQQAFSDIITGIGRMSPLILDNLGILTGGEQGMSAYAESIGKTTDALTDMERRQYLVNKVLEDSAVVADDAAAGMERYNAARANLKTELGMALTGALPDMAGATGDVMQGAADQLRRGREAADAMGEYKDRLIEMQQAGVITGAQLGAMTQQWMILNQQVRDGTLNVDQAKLVMLSAFPEMRSAVEAYTVAQAEATFQMDLASGAAIRKEQADLRAAGAAREHAAAERGLAAAIAAGYGAAMDPWLVRRAHDPNAGRGASVQDQIQRDESALRDFQSSLNVRGGGGSGISDAQRLAEQQAREFQSLVESVLNPTQVTGADVSATENGAYQDKWDEEIRRMRADKSIPYYQQAETERQFYSGQRLDMVNWDAVLRSIAEKQQEEAGRQNLLDEALRRAEEAGLGANRAEVAASLGIEDSNITGAEAAGQFATGAKSIDIAADITGQFVEQMKNQQQAWADAGKAAMGAFLGGSDEAMTPDRAKGFVRRMVPFIYDEMKAEGMI
jgi:hypothetical protein